MKKIKLTGIFFAARDIYFILASFFYLPHLNLPFIVD